MRKSLHSGAHASSPVALSPKSKGDGAASAFQRVPMEQILEPALPMREKMNREKMEELKASLQLVGQLVPVILVRRGEGYEIIDGHRRYVAARELGWTELEAKFREADSEKDEAAKVHANTMREDVNPAEEAIYYGQLMERDHLDLDGLCRVAGRSADYISDRFRLLRGDRAVFDALRAGTITLGVARALNRCDDDVMRASYLDQAIRSGTSARVVEGWIAEWRTREGRMPPSPPGLAEATPQSSSEPYHRACMICGGDKDQFNLVDVVLHRWEWEGLEELLQKAGKKGVTLSTLSEGIDKLEG